jgi:ubiquinone/menaquinone biosynthesis C-methylase UbiE
MTEDMKIREFWDHQAMQFGASDLATAPDSHYRSLEIRHIMEHLRDREHVLDIGCGNGFSTLKFAARFKESTFVGADYSSEMIRAACAQSNDHNVSFLHADVEALSDYAVGPFDTVISERCLINLGDWERQRLALLEMKKIIKPTGKIILVENFKEGLQNLNQLRQQFGLHAIPVRWHNSYLPYSEFSQFAKEHFEIEYEENIGNLYYLMSRVLYATLCKTDGTEPEYGHAINEIASRLPSLGTHHYSPNFLHVLRNKS